MTLPPGKSRIISRAFLANKEHVLFETHPSRWFYFPDLVALSLIALLVEYSILTWLLPPLPAVPIVTGALSGHVSLSSAPWLWGLILVFLAVLVVAYVAWGRRIRQWSEFAYAVTDTRVIQQRKGKWVGGSDIQEIPLRQIRDVELIRNARAPSSGIGTLRVRSLSSVALEPERIEDGYLLGSGHNDPRAPVPQPGDGDVIDPRSDFALTRAGSGVEWWIGIPRSMHVERLIASQSRAVFHDDTPTPVVPTPPSGPGS